MFEHARRAAADPDLGSCLDQRDRAVGITVTRIDRGTEAEVAKMNLGDDLAGLVPFYVQYTVSNETGNDFAWLAKGTDYEENPIVWQP